MKTGRVVVLPYDPAWKADFEQIKSELEQGLGSFALAIEHVGSTAVEGLSAKPCIDIDVVIRDESVFQAVVDRLAAMGYCHEGNLGIRDREAFKYTNKPHLQTHHLYVCPAHSEELRRHLTFRDFLRRNPEAVQQYSTIKKEAARRFPDNIDQYMAYKASCIEKLYGLCGLI